MTTGPWGAAPPPPSSPPAATEPVSQYPCPACGALLGYEPGETQLVCPFCGARSDIPAAAPEAAADATRERDFLTAMAEAAGDGGPALETQLTVGCDACGAQVEFEPGAHATRCPFCATPLVADPSSDRRIRPQALLPFALDARQARGRVRDWLKGLWFAPSELKHYARDDGALTGIYAPFWTFDARTETAYSGQRGDSFTQTVRGPGGKPQTVTKVRWRRVSGRTARDFDDVLVFGAGAPPEDFIDRVGPWDLSALQPYGRDWLAGFRAEAYTVDLPSAWNVARVRIDAVIRGDVRRAIGGDQQRIERLDSRIEDVTFKHVLLPIWVGAYRYRGRTYRLVLNGRTGAVHGERPWSAWKLALAALGAIAVAGIAAAVIAAAQGMR
ncbi:MAG: primosomal protein N' (replication factor Y) - superfamily II helicase [Rubrimonas sp.]